MARNFRTPFLPVGLAAIVLAALAYFGLSSLRKPEPLATTSSTTPAPETEAQTKERLHQLSEKLARADILEADRLLRNGRHDQALACLARAIRTNGSRPAEIRLMSLLQYRNWALPVNEDRTKTAKWKPSNIVPFAEAAGTEGDNSASGRLTPVDTSGAALERVASLTPEGARRLRALDNGLLLQLLDATTNLPYMDIPQEAPMRSAALSTDGRWLAASAGEVKSWKQPAASEGLLHYWDTMRGNALITPVDELSEDPGASPGSGSSSAVVTPFEKASNLQPGYKVEMRTLSPDSRRVILLGRTGEGEGDRVLMEVWNLATLKQEGPRFTAHGTYAQAASWMADGMRFVSSTSTGNTPQSTSYVEIWNCISDSPIITLKADGRVTAAALHPDGRVLATSTASQDSSSPGIVEFRDLPSLTQRPLSLAFGAVATAYSKDGRYLLAVDNGGRGILFDAETLVPLTDPLGDELRPGEGRRSNWHVEEFATSVRCTTPGGKTYTWRLAPKSTAPDWLPRLAEALGGNQVMEGGQIAPLPEPLRNLEDLRKELAGADPGDDWVPTGRWLLADRAKRTIAPFSETTVADMETRLVKENSGIAAHRALLLNPANTKAREIFAKLGSEMLSNRDSSGMTLATNTSPKGAVKPRGNAGKSNNTTTASGSTGTGTSTSTVSDNSTKKGTAKSGTTSATSTTNAKVRPVDTTVATNANPPKQRTPANPSGTGGMSDPKAFVLGYFRAGNSGSGANQATMFADTTEYFDHKTDRQMIHTYVSEYQSKWPDRQFEIVGEPEVTKTRPGQYRVIVKFRYTIRNDDEGIQGISRNTFVLRQEGKEGKGGSFEIISLKSDLIQRASMPLQHNRKDPRSSQALQSAPGDIPDTSKELEPRSSTAM